VGGAWACQSKSCIKTRGRVGGNVLDFVAAMEQCSVRGAAIKLQMWILVPAAGGSAAPVGKEPIAETSAGKEPEPNLVSGKNNGVGESESNKPLTFTLKDVDSNHLFLTEGDSRKISRKLSALDFLPARDRCMIAS
jgi:hypothetical protein